MTTDALIIKGDCLNVMAGLPAASIDAIVTDPPYGLSAGPVGYIGEKTGGGFMGKDWDSGVPGVSFWKEALRVAKPGCHLLAAGGSRTYHRLTCAIEDAGWEIRDCIIWMYGSGFPKSHDVSKAIDREAGAEPIATGAYKRASIQGKPFEESYSEQTKQVAITAPATEAAKQWQGWGTALKPAFEPFILARKPLDGTVANNVQRHGCGGLNVDGCRVGSDNNYHDKTGVFQKSNGTVNCYGGFPNKYKRCPPATLGRWPANVIHDGSDEVMGLFPQQTSGANPTRRNVAKFQNAYGEFAGQEECTAMRGAESGSAARFFYCAKASPSEREEGLNGLEAIHRINGNKWTDLDYRVQRGERPQSAESGPRTNHHPTVKPVDLMKYLCRLITPPGGLILDPFCGSGSTGVAAMREGFNFIGIELNADYAEIARRRIDHERNKTPLFSNVI